MQLAIQSSRPPSSQEDARAARDAIRNNPKDLSPAEREAIIEPYQKGARGHAWDVRICDRNWGFSPAAIEGVDTLLYHGEQDPLAPAVMGRVLAAAIPGCQATFYPGEGHDVYRRHTREILTALTALPERTESAE